MNLTMEEYYRQMEVMRMNNLNAQRNANRIVGRVALVLITGILVVFALHFAGIITLA
jgi:hypothetical protein